MTLVLMVHSDHKNNIFITKITLSARVLFGNVIKANTLVWNISGLWTEWEHNMSYKEVVNRLKFHEVKFG
jgi:hypothetical protein